MTDTLRSGRLYLHEQLQQCRNGARMTTAGLEPAPGEALVEQDECAVAALQQALVDTGIDIGTSGPDGNGVDGDYGQSTWTGVLVFKEREGLAVPGGPNHDGVTSRGTTTRLDEIFRHEVVDGLVAELAGTPFDPGGRVGDLQPTELDGVFECPAVNGGRLIDASADATYVNATFDAQWQAQGGILGVLGAPIGQPFTLESGRAAIDFDGGRLIDDPSGVLTMPRWALNASEGSFDLGEPVGSIMNDPYVADAQRVPLERGAAFADTGGNAFAFPAALLQAWDDAVAGGTDVGAPAGPPTVDLVGGVIGFPFENTMLSVPLAAELVPLVAAIGAAAGVPSSSHLRFLVPFSNPTPKPNQIRPPQLANSAEHFVLGDTAFPAMVADIRAATAAGSAGFVYLANWWLRHDYPFLVGGSSTTIGGELIAAIAANVEVRGLVWDGTSVTNKFNKPATVALNAAGADVRLDGQVQFAGSHHQKLLICFDGAVVTSWVGGIDWNEDRIRSVYTKVPGVVPKTYPGYPMIDDHVRVRGAGAHDLLSGWLDRWEARTKTFGLRGRSVPVPVPMGSVIVQVSHTYGPGCPFPGGVKTAATTIEHVIRQAQNYIYIEDQYLFMTTTMEAALVDRLIAGVTIIAVITNNELHEVPFGKQARFDAFQRLAAASVLSGVGGFNPFEALAVGGNPLGPLAYTHCKVVIVDDEAAVIGSVNSSNRSWTHDTEVASLFVDTIGSGGTAPGGRGFARQARCDLWSAHGATGAVSGDHNVDIPAFLATATSSGMLRGYDLSTRPPMSPLDYAGMVPFPVIIDPK